MCQCTYVHARDYALFPSLNCYIRTVCMYVHTYVCTTDCGVHVLLDQCSA